MNRSLPALALVLVCSMLVLATGSPPAVAAVGDAMRCGVSRDTFARANSTDLGPSWNEIVPGLEISGNHVTSSASTGNPLAIFVPVAGAEHQVCATFFGGETAGAYAAIAVDANAAQGNNRMVKLIDAAAPFDGNFDTVVAQFGNLGGPSSTIATASLSPSIATARVSLRTAAANGGGTDTFVEIDKNLDGFADLSVSGHDAATATPPTTTFGIGAMGGTTVDDVSSPSAAPGTSTSTSVTTTTEQAAPVVLDPGLTATDPDDTLLVGARVTLVGTIDPGDLLSFADTAAITGTTSASGTVLSLAGTASVAAYQAALRTVRFASTTDAPRSGHGARTSVDDGDTWSRPSEKQINITPVNDTPALATSAGAASYVENATRVAVDSGLTVDDPDLGTLTGAAMEIVGPSAGERLEFTAQSGISGSFAAGRLDLSGTATYTEYQAALRSVTYASSEDDPPRSRTVQVEVADRTLRSVTVSRTVSIVPVDDAAGVATSPTPLGYRQGDPSVVADPGLVITDPDDTVLEGATVTVMGAASGDLLTTAGTDGLRSSYAGGVLRVTGPATVAAYQAALRTVRFSTSRPDTPRTVVFSALDGDLVGPGAGRTIAVATAVPVVLSDVTVKKRVGHGKAATVRLTLSGAATVTLGFVKGTKRKTVRREFAAAGSYVVRVKGLRPGRWRVTVSAAGGPGVSRRFRVL